MTKTALKKQLHLYIDQADEQVLKIVHMILEREIEGADYEITAEDKRTTSKRRAEMVSGKVKGIPHKKLMADLKTHLRKKNQ